MRPRQWRPDAAGLIGETMVEAEKAKLAGYDDIWCDNRGVWCGDERIDRPIEKVTHTYPPATRKRKAA
jgi:hypothetical protein